MENLLKEYQDRINNNSVQLKSVKKRLFASSMVRLMVFLLTFFAVYLWFGNTPIVILSLVIGIGVFLFLISKHTDLIKVRKYLQAVIDINQRIMNCEFIIN